MDEIDAELLRKHPIFHDAPTSSKDIHVQQWGEDEQTEHIRFFCYQDVLRELHNAAQYHDEPSITLLTGQFGIDAHGPFLEVTGFEAYHVLSSWDETLTELRAGIEHLMHIHGHGAFMAVERISPIGFFVHQPGGQAKLEPPMVHVHMSLFNIPFQITLVLDLQVDHLACYARQPGGRFFNAAIHIVSNRDTNSTPILNSAEDDEAS